MTLLRRAISASQKRSAPQPDLQIPPPGAFGRMATSGVYVNAASALTLPSIWACVRILTTSISTLPLKVYTMVDGIQTEVLPQPSVIQNPFSQATLIEGLDQIMRSLLLRGNAYLAVSQRDSNLRASQLLILPPDAVGVARDTAGNVVYKVAGKAYDNETIWHVKNMVEPGSVLGIDPIEHWRTTVGIGIAAQEYASRFYSQGALQDGFISMDDAMEDDDARRAAEYFAMRHTGLENAHYPGVLTGGAKWVDTSITPDQAQFLQSREFSQVEVAMMFGIPPHLLAMVDRTTSWGTGIEVQNRAFVDFSLRNYIVRIQKALSALLPANQWVEFDTDQLTRADTATRFANYAIALMNGFMNADEVRAAEGNAPIPDGLGQTYTRLLTLGPITEQSNLAVPAPPPALPAGTPPPVVDPDNPDAGPAVAPSEAPPAIES